MWRVCFITCSPLRLGSGDRGPWHADRASAQRWADWFRAQGYRVGIEDKHGDIHEPGQPVRNLARPRFAQASFAG